VDPGSESNIYESFSRIELSTDDGLHLSLSRSDGQEPAVCVGSTCSTSDRPWIRFEEVVEVSPARNLIDPGTASSWGIPEDHVAETVLGRGGPWIRVSGDNGFRPKRTVHVNQTEPEPLIASAWCQARVKGKAFGWFNRHLAVNVRARYAVDQADMPELSAHFGQYDHGPQFNRLFICPDRPIRSVGIDLSVPGPECSAWYRDVRLDPARYQISAPAAPLEHVDSTVRQSFELENSDLRGMLTLQPQEDRIEIRGFLESLRSADRAVSACIALPFDAAGGLWHDDVRSSRRIAPGGIYRNVDWYGAGRDGMSSRYPLGCVEAADGVGLALGISMAEPRVFTIGYDALHRELLVRFDIGLSPDAGRWANRASFCVFVFQYQDGFRGAADKYHRMFEWAFRKRLDHQGLWLPFMSPTAIAGGWEDFQFRFLESVGAMGWAERERMLSFRYAEPWIHHQEFPPHMPCEEVRGAVRPRAALELARRIASGTGIRLPLETRRNHAAYPGAYIADKWGEPQGYFFRHPGDGRNENMMIANPSILLPPPAGSDLSYGALQEDIVRETMGVIRQWSLRGWSPARVSHHPFLAVDTRYKAEGGRSVRLDPVEAGSYFEQYLRGISQVFLYELPVSGPFTFSFHARAEHLPPEGTALRWRVIFWFEDGTSVAQEFPLCDLTLDWRYVAHTLSAPRRPLAVCVSLESPAWTPDPTVLWLDGVSLQAQDGPRVKELLLNGGFEDAELLPCRLDGVYLDTMECYTCNLNYRRDHWACTQEPLTFDSARDPAMHQVFSHVGYARHMAEWLRPLGRLVFGNCTPRTPFAAPYLDVLGNELDWKPGGTWTPWPDAEFNFARFMAAAKPYCLLQYGDLTEEEQGRYMKRCLFYGVLPSNQAAPSGGWYWADPVAVARHRGVFSKYSPVIIEVAEAGWQPLTLARTATADVWVERFGTGDAVYLTIFNPAGTPRSTVVSLDRRLGIRRTSRLVDIINHRRISWLSPGESFQVHLLPEDVAAVRVESR